MVGLAPCRTSDVYPLFILHGSLQSISLAAIHIFDPYPLMKKLRWICYDLKTISLTYGCHELLCSGWHSCLFVHIKSLTSNTISIQHAVRVDSSNLLWPAVAGHSSHHVLFRRLKSGHNCCQLLVIKTNSCLYQQKYTWYDDRSYVHSQGFLLPVAIKVLSKIIQNDWCLPDSLSLLSDINASRDTVGWKGATPGKLPISIWFPERTPPILA